LNKQETERGLVALRKAAVTARGYSLREPHAAFVALPSCDKKLGSGSQIASKPNARRAGIRTGNRARFSLILKEPRPARGYSNAVIWIADAHRDHGKRVVVRSDEKLTAFPELARVTKKKL
jgi:hypothetical protein